MSVFKRWNGTSWETIGPQITSTRFDDTNHMIAPEYSSTSTYNVGDYVIQSDKLYKCISAIESAEEWTAAHWTTAQIGAVNDLSRQLSGLDEYFSNVVFNGKQVYKAIHQGERTAGSIDVISPRATRCTSDVFRLESESCYIISGIPSGYKVALGGIYDSGSTYDSKWQTKDYTGSTNQFSGKFFINVATSSGSGTLKPSDIATITVEVIQDNYAFALKDQVKDQANEVSDRINYLHKIVNYGYGWNREKKQIAGATDSTAIGIKQNGTLLTVDNSETPSGINRYSYFLISNGGIVGSISSSPPSSFKATEFQSGHTYKITLEKLSGTVSPSDYIPTISVYGTLSGTSSVGTLEYDSNKSYRIFTAQEGELYGICFFTSANTSYTNAVFRILMEDITVGNSVFINEISTTVESVRALQTEPCIVFPLLTDIHYGVSESGDNFLFKHKTIDNIKAVLEQIKADFTVCLGDITEGNSAKTKQYSAEVNNMFCGLGLPYLIAIGNHDDNRYANKFTAADMYAYYTAFVDKTYVYNGDTNGRDYYIDLPNYKTRIVVLDSNTAGSYGFPQECVDWFTNTALNTPNDYLVVVLVHQSPIASQNYNNKSLTNGTAIANAIEAYQAGGKPIVQLYGHSHVDVAFTSPYLSIGTNCAKFENNNGDPSLWPSGAVKPTRVMGEVTEDCWDMVVIRPLSRKVDCVRFGAGDDRSFTF